MLSFSSDMYESYWSVICSLFSVHCATELGCSSGGEWGKHMYLYIHSVWPSVSAPRWNSIGLFTSFANLTKRFSLCFDAVNDSCISIKALAVYSGGFHSVCIFEVSCVGFFPFANIKRGGNLEERGRFDMVGERICLSCYRASAVVSPWVGWSLGWLRRGAEVGAAGSGRSRQVGLRSTGHRCLVPSGKPNSAAASHLAGRQEGRCVISSGASSSFKSCFCVFILSHLFLIEPFWWAWWGPSWEPAGQSRFWRGSLTRASAKAV